MATEFVVGAKGTETTDKYYEKYGEEVNGHSAEAYTTTWVLGDAFKAIVDAGEEVTSQTIQKELTDIKIDSEFSNGAEIILPYDTIAFEEDNFNGTPYLNQNLNATLTVTQIQGGKYTTIWPFDIAAADLVYPAEYK